MKVSGSERDSGGEKSTQCRKKRKITEKMQMKMNDLYYVFLINQIYNNNFLLHQDADS